MRPAHPAQSLERGPAPDLRLCRGAGHHRRLPGPGLPGRPPGRRRTTAGPKPSRRPGHAGRVPPAPSGWQLALGGSPQPQPRTRRRRPAPPDRRHPARHQCAQGQRGRTPAGRPGIHRHQRRHLHHRCPAQHPAHQQGFQPHHRLRAGRCARAEPAPAPLGQSRPRFLPRHVGKARPLRQLAGRDREPAQGRFAEQRMAVDFLRAQCRRRDQPLRRPVQRPFRTPGGRRTHPVPVELRHADRPAQPRPVRRPPRPGIAHRPPLRAWHGADPLRPRPFPGAQRHARPAGRRPDPGRSGSSPAIAGAGRRYRRPAERQRVRLRDGQPRPRARRPRPRPAHSRCHRRALRRCRPVAVGHGKHRHQCLPQERPGWRRHAHLRRCGAAARHAPQAGHGADPRTGPPRRLPAAGQGQRADRRHHQPAGQAGADRTTQPDRLHSLGGK